MHYIPNISKYWGYHLQQIFESDLENPQFMEHLTKPEIASVMCLGSGCRCLPSRPPTAVRECHACRVWINIWEWLATAGPNKKERII